MKTMYLTNEARESHIKEITRLTDVINHIPGNHLNYLDAQRLTIYLNELKENIKHEMNGDK